MDLQQNLISAQEIYKTILWNLSSPIGSERVKFQLSYG